MNRSMINFAARRFAPLDEQSHHNGPDHHQSRASFDIPANELVNLKRPGIIQMLHDEPASVKFRDESHELQLVTTNLSGAHEISRYY